jgi:hypothetical protein
MSLRESSSRHGIRQSRAIRSVRAAWEADPDCAICYWGDLDSAIAAFEHAAEIEDRLNYDKPETLPFAARHRLGAAELEAGRARTSRLPHRVSERRARSHALTDS